MSTLPISVAAAQSQAQPVRRATAKPSYWLWVPWVWLLFAATREPSRWLMWKVPTNIGADDLSGSPVDRMVMTMLMVLGLYVLGTRFHQTKRVLSSNIWVVALFAYMSLSILWSNFPDYSLRRCLRSVGAFEMVVVVLTERYPFEAVRALLRRLYLVHIPLSVIAIKYVRNIGVFYNWSGLEEEWIGLSVDKNSLGQVATCGGIFYLWRVLEDWPKRKLKGKKRALILNCFLLFCALWLLRGSKTVHSSTAILGYLSCALVLIALQFVKKRAVRAKRIIIGTAFAVGLMMPFGYMACEALGFTPLEMVVAAAGRNMTFTDRTYLWADILDDAAKSPILGVGVGAFWVGPPGYDLYPLPNWSLKTPQWRPEQGHNGYIDTYAEIGAIGLILLLVALAIGFFDALEDLESNFEYGSFRLVLLLAIVISNITETSFLKGTHDLWFLCLLMILRVPKPRRVASEGTAASRWPAMRTHNPQLIKRGFGNLSRFGCPFQRLFTPPTATAPVAPSS